MGFSGTGHFQSWNLIGSITIWTAGCSDIPVLGKATLVSVGTGDILNNKNDMFQPTVPAEYLCVQVILILILIIWKIINIAGRGWTIPCKSFIIIDPNMGGWLPLCSLFSSNHPVAQNDMFVPPRRTHEHRCVCVSQINVDTVARSMLAPSRFAVRVGCML